MFAHLFLAVAVATTSEIPTTDITPSETQALQEIIAVFAQEETAAEAIALSTPENSVTAAAEKPAPIIITNAIEPSMLEYKHWTGKYSPEQFAISINGTEIESGKTCAIPSNATTVEIGYTYSFMNGMKSGGRKISYQLNENITHVNITFDWKNEWRVVVDNGKATKEVTA